MCKQKTNIQRPRLVAYGNKFCDECTYLRMHGKDIKNCFCHAFEQSISGNSKACPSFVEKVTLAE